MDNISDVKQRLHASYDHAVRVGGLLIFSVTDYEQLLAKVDQVLDGLTSKQCDDAGSISVDMGSMTTGVANQVNVPESSAITNPAVRQAFGLDASSVASTESVAVETSSDSASTSAPAPDFPVDEIPDSIDATSATSSVADVNDDTPVESVNGTSESVSETSLSNGTQSLAQESELAAAALPGGTDMVSDDTVSNFDAGAMLREAHDSLVSQQVDSVPDGLPGDDITISAGSASNTDNTGVDND